VLYRYKVQLPTKYFLILRGLTTVEGTGRELYPDFNVFEVAEPYVRRLAVKRFSPRVLAGENVDRATDIIETFSRYPGQLSDVLDEVQETLRETRRIEEFIDRGLGRASRFFNRLSLAVFAAALIIASPHVTFGPHVGGVPVFAALTFWLALMLGLVLLIGLARSGGI
ncbi:MAG: hypothetical protein ACYDGR_17720, partial [Candidatus Dormibacteria bacterium]